MIKTCHASCHCRAIRFVADIDLKQGTVRCNCSFCIKIRSWVAVIKPAAFRLLAGEDDLTTYQFASKTEYHYFCRHCGVNVFWIGNSPTLGEVYGVSVACFDDVPADELIAAPIAFVDGQNNNWRSPPALVEHL